MWVPRLFVGRATRVIYFAVVVFAIVVLHVSACWGARVNRALSIIEHRYSAEHMDREARLAFDREALDRTSPAKGAEPTRKPEIVVPPDIEAQLADAPEWEQADTRARAIELYEELERLNPDMKQADRWGRVHKLLELETEAVESTV
jgi:hypothetical protein